MKKILGVPLLLATLISFGQAPSHPTKSNAPTSREAVAVHQAMAEKSMELEVTPDSNALYLIEEVFIGSRCFEVSNASLKGAFEQVGEFSGGGASINMENGIILSTGNIDNARGPNDASNAETRFGSLNNDLDLSILSNGSSFQDVAAIEFDFTPTVSNVSFEYVFASEEYCEYVNTDFNDLFGFFISGPGIDGPFSNNGENIALVPQTNTPVSINTVNHLLNEQYYVNNIPLSQGQGCNSEEGQAVDFIEFDGFTTVLKASIEVIPCETYHIKLVVGDRGDDRYDSAVFLKANSFSAGSSISSNAGIVGNQTDLQTAYEGCSNGYFLFERQSISLEEEVVVHFNISDASTAQPGVDYASFPDSIVIPAGENSAQLPVTVLEDNDPNETEVLILELVESCDCAGASASLNIFDLPPMELTMPDVTVCGDTMITVAPSISGGVAGYSYEWQDGSTVDSLVIAAPPEIELISLSVRDACGQQVSTTSTITNTQPGASLSGSGILCDGHPEDSLQVDLTGPGPFELVYGWDGQTDTTQVMQATTFELPVTSPGDYELVSVTTNGCAGTVSGQATVNFQEVAVDLQAEDVTCHSAANGRILSEVSGGTAPYTFVWNHTGESIDILSDLDTGTYQLTVTDQIGCISTAITSVSQPLPLSVSLETVEHIDCATPFGKITTAASGGTGTLQFGWNNDQNTSNISELPAGQYELVVSDENNCEATLSVVVEDRIEYPTALMMVNDTLDCVTEQVMVTATGSSQGPGYVYQWTTPDDQIIADSLALMADQAGEFQLIITDSFSRCQDTATVEVAVDTLAPIADAGPPDSLTCLVSTLSLNGNTSQNEPVSYSWSTTDGMITSGAGTPDPTINAPGTYRLQILNERNGCRAVDSVLITENRDQPIINFDAADSITCVQPSVLLSGSGSSTGPEFSYSWQTMNGSIISDTTGAIISVNEPGDYFLEITDQRNGCSQIDSLAVLANRTFPQVNAGPDQQLNCAYPTIQLQAALSDDGPNFDISWNTLVGLQTIDDATLSPSVDQAGTFELQITNTTNGCVSRDTVRVTANFESPLAQIEIPALLTCQDTVISISAANAVPGTSFAYQWTTSNGHIVAGANTLTPEVNAPGFYQLVITQQESACSDTASVIINQNTEFPTLSIEEPEVLTCQLQEVSITANVNSASDNLSYLWESAEGQISGAMDTQNTTVNEPGTYLLSVTNLDNGCQSETSVTVIENVVYPEAAAGPDQHLDCQMTTATLDGSSSSMGDTLTYRWYDSDQQINPITDTTVIQVDVAGTFILEITNYSNGCVAFDTVSVTIDTLPPVAEAGLPDTLTCEVTTLSLNGTASSSGPAFSYQWLSPDDHPIVNESTLSASVSQAGTYQLTVVNNENHCQASDEVMIAIDTLAPVISMASPEPITCERTSLNLAASIAEAAHFSIQWESDNGLLLEDTETLQPLIGAAGNYTIQVANLENGCTNQSTVSVAADTIPPVAEAGTEGTLNCQITSVQLDGTQSTAGNVSYAWSSANNQVITSADTPTPLVQAPDTYFLQVTDLQNGCQSTDSVIVNQDNTLPGTYIAPPDTLTCRDTLITITGNSSEENPTFLYRWLDQDGTIVGDNNTLDVSTPGSYQLQITNPENHCTDSASVSVVQDVVPPIAEAGPSAILNCMDTEVELDGSQSSAGPIYQYQWTDEGGQILENTTDHYALVNAPGIFHLAVTNIDNGCTSTDQVEVGLIVPQSLELEIEPPPCHGDLGAIRIGAVTNGMPPFLYSIDGGQQFFTERNFNGLAPGGYDLVIQDANGCTLEKNVQIQAPPALELALPDQISLSLGDSFALSPLLNIPFSEVERWRWSPADGLSCTDCPTPQATPRLTSTYKLVVTTADGCQTEAMISIIVDKRQAIYIPNAFSPHNLDGVNDQLVVFTKPGAVKEVIRMQVFDRWGSQFFSRDNYPPNDPDFGWDGRFMGQPVPTGIYVYWVELELADGKRLVLKGDVLLVD